MGKYSCYALPLPYSGVVGSSRVEISIEKYDNEFLKFGYDVFDTDPFSKWINLPFILIKNFNEKGLKVRTAVGREIKKKNIIKAHLGDDIIITCPVINPTFLVWYKTETQNLKNISDKRNLLIKNATTDDFGKYSCIVHIGSRFSTHEFHVLKYGNVEFHINKN